MSQPSNTAKSLADVCPWTLPDTMRITGHLGWEQDARPDKFRRHLLETENGEVAFHSDGWVSADRRQSMRYCRLQTRKVDAAVITIYPTASPHALPVFVAEWVVVAHVFHLALIDVAEIGQRSSLHSNLSQVFPAIGGHAAQLLGSAVDESDWFKSIRSPWALHTSSTVEQEPAIRAIFLQYLTLANSEFFLNSRLAANVGSDHDLVTQYKNFVMINTPGRKWISKLVGPEFTDEFMSKWHYGPA